MYTTQFYTLNHHFSRVPLCVGLQFIFSSPTLLHPQTQCNKRNRSYSVGNGTQKNKANGKTAQTPSPTPQHTERTQVLFNQTCARIILVTNYSPWTSAQRFSRLFLTVAKCVQCIRRKADHQMVVGNMLMKILSCIVRTMLIRCTAIHQFA